MYYLCETCSQILSVVPKVLRILNRLNVGGPTLNVAYLSKYLSGDYETEVLAGHKEEHEGSSEYVLKDLGVKYEFVPGMYRKISLADDFKAFQFIRKAVKRFLPDVVHTHAAKAGALGRMAAYYSSKRPRVIIHTYHGNVFDGYFSPLKTKIFLMLERYFCRISTAIIAISEAQKDDLVTKYKLAPAEKVHVVRLGFDLSGFAEQRESKREKFRNQYALDEDTVVVTITGRLAPVKNHKLFIDAIHLLKKEHSKLKIKFFIVGNGESCEDIVRLLKNYGISFCFPEEENRDTDVIFTSWRKDIDVINAGSDIIALTSLNEGTPVSIIEALASQKAVICTNVGGVRDVVSDGVTGLLSGLDAAEFAKKLYLLASQPELRTSLAEKGEKFVLENYTYNRLVADIEKLYETLLTANS